MSDPRPRDNAFYVEIDFATPPPDWAASGTTIKLIDPDVTGIDQDMQQNENTQPRRLKTNDLVRGLKSGSTFPHMLHFTAAGATAAEAAQAVATPESVLIKSALGGQRLGWSIGADGAGSVSVPGVAADPGYTPSDWIFWFDASVGTGSLHRVESSTATTLTLLNDLPLAPDDTADVAHATIVHYPDEAALNDPSNANNTTLSWFIQGEDAEDRQEMSGCKPTLALESIVAGEQVKFSFEYAVTTWPDVTPAKVTIPGAPSGIAPVIPGSGKTTSVWLGDVGGPLVKVDCRGAIDVELNYAWAPVTGNCGTEGVKGYTGADVTAGLTLRVRFDDDYKAEFVAGIKKHCLIQIGDQPGDAIGIYFGELEYAEPPDRENEGDQTVSTLTFMAHEDPADPTGIADPSNELNLRRAPVVLIHTA